MASYPLEFTVSANSAAGMASTWQSKSPESETALEIAIPKEFDGPGGAWSPEGLFAAALGNCFIATFKVLAQMSKLDFKEIKIDISLEIAPNEEKKLWVPKAHLKAWLSEPSNPDRALQLMEKASKSCLIMNSVKTEKTSEFFIV